ncbi:MAG: small multi-drug export protein [Candidatus Thermoplasmatota archaeon]
MNAKDGMCRLAMVLLPAAIASAYILLLYAVLDPVTFAVIGGLMLLYFLTPIGKYVLIPGALLIGVPGLLDGLRALHGLKSPAADIALVVSAIVMVDAMCSLFLVLNFAFVERIPFLGTWIRRLEERGRERLERRKVEGIAFLGLTGFVTISVQGSGGIGATILGKVAGMRGSAVFTAIVAGATIGCSAIATATWFLGGPVMDAHASSILESVGLVALLAALGAIIYIYSNGGHLRRGNRR